MSSVNLLNPEKNSPWRKISIGSWRPNGASSIFLKETIDLTHFKELKQMSSKRISFNSYFAHAVGKSLAENPRLNSILRFGRIYPRKDISMFFHVYNDKSWDDLTGIKIEYDKSTNLYELEDQFTIKREKCLESDHEFKLVKKVYRLLPTLFSRAFLDITSFLSYSLNLDLTKLGVPKDPFGSIMITNVSSFGMQLAFTPIAPYTRIPVVICVGAPNERCIVKDGKPAVATQLDLGIHFDHRIIDGAQIAAFLKSLRQHLYNIELIQDQIPLQSNEISIQTSHELH